jgi:hypothetical protein
VVVGAGAGGDIVELRAREVGGREKWAEPEGKADGPRKSVYFVPGCCLMLVDCRC